MMEWTIRGFAPRELPFLPKRRRSPVGKQDDLAVRGGANSGYAEVITGIAAGQSGSIVETTSTSTPMIEAVGVLEHSPNDDVLDWLGIHPEVLAPYVGRWVAFNGRNVVADGATFADAVMAARQRGVDDPFLVPSLAPTFVPD